jgi:hypothetical protein
VSLSPVHFFLFHLNFHAQLIKQLSFLTKRKYYPVSILSIKEGVIADGVTAN